MIAATVHLAAETRSFQRAAMTMKHVLGHSLSAKTIERLTRQVGNELTQSPDQWMSHQEVVIPEVAVVSCDGGRIRTRVTNQGPGVHHAAWRETKNASFERMHAPQIAEIDPCPQLPDTFRQVGHVAKIAEMAAFSGVSASSTKRRPRYRGPRRILRTCLASMVCSRDFGSQMEGEAQRRSFFAANRRVFIGDGQAWNWSIWEAHFPTFTPILDFIHALQYVYAAAAAWESTDEARWQRYLHLAEEVWQGRVQELITLIETELNTRDVPIHEVTEDHPLRALVDAARYLRNNQTRMDYPRYRREGLPITSSPMESLIKQMNHRVKGTEMFWNDPAGAEAILQVRAASLSDDSRLANYLNRRPGCPFTRRTESTAA